MENPASAGFFRLLGRQPCLHDVPQRYPALQPPILQRRSCPCHHAMDTILQSGALNVTLMDDDGTLQLRAESGGAARLLVNTFPDAPFDFCQAGGGAGGIDRSLVRVSYVGVDNSGQFISGSFVALCFAIPLEDGEQVLFLPRNGSPSVLDIFEVSSVTTLSRGANGVDYSDFGFGHDTLYRFSGDTGQFIQGFVFDDFMQGDGGDGNDRTFGGFGNDVLWGGTGNDLINGQAGDDSLRDGDGIDTLAGGIGVDVFVMSNDRATDRITDLNPGRVKITHSGETLILSDAAGLLTAADLTAADFL
jgi:Ca2+-binding RTX toxin-like protein